MNRREHGAALVWAIILMVVVAGLVAAFSMMVQRSAERSKDASRRVANNATVQAATTRIAMGLQINLASEQDYYTLDANDLRTLADPARTGAQVYDPATLNRLPADFRQTAGVWQHAIVGGRHKLQRVTGATLANSVVREPMQPDTRACTAAGLPTSLCSGGTVASYWQVYRVIQPDVTGLDNANLTVIIKSWLGSANAGAWSKASYARVELRPGRFADYQLISDGNIAFGAGANIDGPVHSNGFPDAAFTVNPPPGVTTPGWVSVDGGVSCRGAASITIRAGTISGAGGRCNAQGQTNQSISFLRAIDSIDQIEAAAWARVPGTRRFVTNGRHPGTTFGTPYDTAWRVRLNGRTMSVHAPDGSSDGTVSLGRVNAFSFDDDVRVQGRVDADTRVTIAARRDGAAPAGVYVDGNIVKGDPKTSAVGLLAQGDVVIWQTGPEFNRWRARVGNGSPCLVGRVEAAMVAATGSVTIPTTYTTPEFQNDAPRCTQPIRLHGSIAGHHPPKLVWNWPNGWAGFRTRDYTWDENLRRNPPPYFPLTGNWQPVASRSANLDCHTTRLEDPSCR